MWPSRMLIPIAVSRRCAAGLCFHASKEKRPSKVYANIVVKARYAFRRNFHGFVAGSLYFSICENLAATTFHP